MAVHSMPSQGNDVRLIEAGFPCHQVGAETRRERGASSALPPLYYLHVWWARRPLTPSRAAVLGSLLPADTDVDWFLRELGIEQVQADVNGVRWVLDDKLIERVVTLPSGEEVLPVDAVVQRALERERQRRSNNRTLIDRLVHDDPALRHDPVIKRWSSENVPIPDHDDIPDTLPVYRVAADPDWANRRIAWETEKGIRTTDDKYGYARAFSKAVWPPFFGHLQPNWGHFLLISHDRFMILDRSTIAEAAVDPPGVVVVHVLNHGYVSLGKCLELITA